MPDRPLRTTVIGSYPFPAWLEFASQTPRPVRPRRPGGDAGRRGDRRHARPAGGRPGRHHRRRADPARLQPFLLRLPRRHRPGRRPARAASGRPPTTSAAGTRSSANCARPRGLGAVEEFKRLKRSARSAARRRRRSRRACRGRTRSAAGCCPTTQYRDRYALTEALLPIVRAELEALVAAGCREITVDEPSMSCYAYKEDPRRFVDIFNRTVEPVVGQVPALDAPVLRQLQGPGRRPAAVRADVPGVPGHERGRDPPGDGQPGVRRDRDDRRDRRATRRGGGHHRREELLHRDAGGRGRPRAAVPEARPGRSAVASPPTAA